MASPPWMQIASAGHRESPVTPVNSIDQPGARNGSGFADAERKGPIERDVRPGYARATAGGGNDTARYQKRAHALEESRGRTIDKRHGS